MLLLRVVAMLHMEKLIMVHHGNGTLSQVGDTLYFPKQFLQE